MNSTDKKNEPRSLSTILLLLVAVAAFSAAVWTYFSPRLSVVKLPELPAPPVEGLAEAIQEQILEAYARVDAYPREPAANGLLGMTLEVNRRLDAASIAYERAHLLDPASFEWPYYLAGVQKRLGHDDLAANSYALSLASKPDYVPTILALADIRLEKNLAEEARALYASALELDPRSAYAQLGMGRALTALGKPDAALAHLQSAVEFAPAFGEAHYALALAYRGKGDADAATRHLNRYKENDGIAPPTRDSLAMAVKKLDRSARNVVRQAKREANAGRLDSAIELFEQAIEADSSNIAPHVHLIDLFHKKGNIERAAYHYQAAVEKKSDALGPHIEFAQLLIDEKQLPQARLVLERAFEINPTNSRVYFLLALVESGVGNQAASLENLEKAVEIDPANPDNHFWLAKSYLVAEQSDKAAYHFEQSFKGKESETDFYYLRAAQAYSRIGQFPQALEYLGQAREKATKFQHWKILAEVESMHRRVLERKQAE